MSYGTVHDVLALRTVLGTLELSDKAKIAQGAPLQREAGPARILSDRLEPPAAARSRIQPPAPRP